MQDSDVSEQQAGFMEVLGFSWRCWEKLKGNLFVWEKILLKTKILKWKKPYSKTLQRCCWSKKSSLEVRCVSILAGEQWWVRRGHGTAATTLVTQPAWPHWANLGNGSLSGTGAMLPPAWHTNFFANSPKSDQCTHGPPRTRSFREQMPQAEGVFSTAGAQKLLCYNLKQDRSWSSTPSSSRKWAP